ncbi:C4-dicarboxylate TRAP transporter large permease protein DctM [Roseovarius sp. EC-HK134]|uniref:TRAP transporter large permease protein n=1 Tax=Roseovarius mucosus TaxID=215743 RepID=A0A1V0RPS8_9RHOB|nr:MULTISPECIES: TRAP transporter large permease subunit [Roseovarius]ARE83731.1 C4-dicarboxylate TRAP transporter large permease protein DctM [Roseovarius mucosus]AWZ19636.1 TRAP-type C4-dicarboxylate transport system, large permease component [Roseovarius sp. AK1035]EDM33812.1 TRAP-T family transporter, DctM (12 TMs) subunit [Roseovarius sp. TM1035]MBW4973278.1 TRAP transporter large permease subunit [Roseovarius mucosus]VVT08886.1 C4-dicarboxylate TRAP transporter large permease protein Dct|tara:strand:- start:634 stop:2052 length:1419 start_codon:yes stop_codon:yes gene_type:complete
MTDPQIALMMLGLFLIFVFLGFPIAFTLMAMGIGFGYYAYFDAGRMWRSFDRLAEDAGAWDQWTLWLEGFFNNRIFDLFVNQTYTVMSNEVLTAVPLFLFMGYIVERANIVDRLFGTLNIAARNMPGSMGVAALITCALFATATGIVGAVVTLMGLLALPAMLKARYDPSFASGIICAGGTLGILIPPSIMLIVYAAASSVSIVRLYAAALLPGLTLVGLYLIYVIGRSILQPSVAPKPTKEEIPEIPKTQLFVMILTSLVPLAFLILAVLGSILFGLATPTEAASIGALGGIFLAFAYRAMTWQRMRESVYLTVRTTAMVCWLFVGSYTFSAVFSYLGGEHVISEFVQSMNLTPLMFLLLAQLIIFLLGWPLEWSEIIIIFVPIFLPLLAFFEIDPLFFGILVALNLQTSFLTPPMAMSAYYLKGIAPPEIKLTQIFSGVMPFLFCVFIAMAMMYNFPQIVYYLPELMYGK